jgi:hypothetical protein
VNDQLSHISLFDGAGGLRLGFERAGIRTAAAVELMDGFDITTLDPRSLPACDIISGGPPCQNVSSAAALSKRKTGESLWPHMLRIVRSKAPRWVVVEQPKGGREIILQAAEDLQQFGYGCAARIIGSQHWVPQRRERWYLIARLGARGVDVWNDIYADGLGTSGSHRQGGSSERYLGNCPDCLPGGVFARVSSRVLALVGAGNAVTVPVATWLGCRIVAAQQSKDAPAVHVSPVAIDPRHTLGTVPVLEPTPANANEGVLIAA